MGAVMQFHDRQLALIRRTVAKDCNQNEFDWFIEICKALRLDPLRRQIYAFVFHKNDPDKRTMIPVVAIGGYRAIADRTGNYRPGETLTTLDPDLVDYDGNPIGISFATATVWKWSHGGWFPVTETAYWEEFAPITQTPSGGWDWQDTGEVYPESHKRAGKPINKKVPIGKMLSKLDPTKGNWRTMPRVMLEKCAEAKALRRAWPDDFAGTYVEGELDRADTLDLTPSELADQSEKNDRVAKLGGAGAIMVQWLPAGEIVRVPTGQFGDEAIKFVRKMVADEMPSAVAEWKVRNRASLNDFWAKDKDGFLVLKAEIEKAEELLADESDGNGEGGEAAGEGKAASGGNLQAS